MIDYKSMFEGEDAQDVFLYLSARDEKGISHPHLDRYCTSLSNGRISNIDVIVLVRIMIEEGLIESNSKGGYKKGPYWREPRFMTEGKYGIK